MLAGLSGAQASGFVDQLGDGIRHRLAARGTNLSGGQRQRILISRALAADPEILILDDASSALDYRTDAALRRAVNENYSGTTTIIVAQRVSSVSRADLIIVMDSGEVAGLGTHEELLETCEEYRLTAESQMGAGMENGGVQVEQS